MEKEAIKSYFKNLSLPERKWLLKELEQIDSTDNEAVPRCQEIRRGILNNKQGECPHCGHKKYVRFGKDKGSQRYKCKFCHRSFTEYTGTWMAGIHRKDKIDQYMGLMLEEKSLDKIKAALKINKKTAFDWRHKILSSLSEVDKGDFTGITESDETFFSYSEKGKKIQGRKPRKRGGSTTGKRGISDDQIAVIVTRDRKKEIDLTVATRGRLKKIDLENAIGDRLSTHAILCSDSHVSYKGFAIDKKIEHHPLRSDLRERVKDGLYHIQHVNSTHNKIKKWIDNKFWGVSTKYLQQYMNWFRMKEILKDSRELIRNFAEKSAEDTKAHWRHQQIAARYKMIISSLN